MLLNKIRELCKQEGISIAELERKLKFGNGTIQKWDNAQPSFHNIKVVANYFNISIDSLDSDSKIPSKESRDIANEYDSLNSNQRGMVKLYISILKNGQTA